MKPSGLALGSPWLHISARAGGSPIPGALGGFDSDRDSELDGTDLRREPLEVRKATLASICARAATGYVSTSTWTTTAG